MTADATADGAVGPTSGLPDAAVRYLVLLPSLQLAVAPTARLASEFLGPGHPVTAGVALGLLYGTVLTGPLALLGLPLDARRRRRERTTGADTGIDADATTGTDAAADADGDANPPRWEWYASAALALAGVLVVHLTLGDALFGLLEPALAVAVAMVPVGLAYHYRRWAVRSARRLG